MNARTLPPEPPPADPPAAGAGTSCLAWHSRFGTILIEVIDGEVYVNGQRVEPAPS